jgi:hypothetical protein
MVLYKIIKDQLVCIMIIFIHLINNQKLKIMKTKNLLLAAMMLFGIGITSCKKAEKGDTGPAGKNGNANVTSVLLNANTWTWDNTNKWSYATFSSVSILTSATASSGAVILYEGSGTSWTAVPYSFNLSGGVTYHALFEYDVNTVTIYKALSDDSNPNPSASQFKLICIPPASIKEHPNVDYTNYMEVRKTFNLKD